VCRYISGGLTFEILEFLFGMTGITTSRRSHFTLEIRESMSLKMNQTPINFPLMSGNIIYLENFSILQIDGNHLCKVDLLWRCSGW
jgi:hypothetical protein